MPIKTVEPSVEQLSVFAERADSVGIVTMLNPGNRALKPVCGPPYLSDIKKLAVIRHFRYL